MPQALARAIAPSHGRQLYVMGDGVVVWFRWEAGIGCHQSTFIRMCVTPRARARLSAASRLKWSWKMNRPSSWVATSIRLPALAGEAATDDASATRVTSSRILASGFNARTARESSLPYTRGLRP